MAIDGSIDGSPHDSLADAIHTDKSACTRDDVGVLKVDDAVECGRDGMCHSRVQHLVGMRERKAHYDAGIKVSQLSCGIWYLQTVFELQIVESQCRIWSMEARHSRMVRRVARVLVWG